MTHSGLIVANSIISTLARILTVQSPAIMITAFNDLNYQMRLYILKGYLLTLGAVLAGVTFLAAADIGHKATATPTAPTANGLAAGMTVRKIALIALTAEPNCPRLVQFLKEQKQEKQWIYD